MGTETEVIGTALAVENIRKAFELRTRVSEREKLIIEGDYSNFVTGDLMKEQQSYILGEQTYPRDVDFRSNLGVLYSAPGQLKRVSENIKRPFILLRPPLRIDILYTHICR